MQGSIRVFSRPSVDTASVGRAIDALNVCGDARFWAGSCWSLKGCCGSMEVQAFRFHDAGIAWNFGVNVDMLVHVVAKRLK